MSNAKQAILGLMAADLVRDLGPTFAKASTELEQVYQQAAEAGYRAGWSAGMMTGYQVGSQSTKADASEPPELAVAMAALADTLAGRDELLAQTLGQIALIPKKVTRDYQGNITGIEPG